MMTTRYPSVNMAMDSSAPAPQPPHPLGEYAASYTDADYLARTDPLTMLRLADVMRVALRAYDEECVYAARMAGATWQEVGDAMGMARQNAQRKYSRLPEPS